MEGLDNANSIHAFIRFEEEGFVERFQQHHFRLVDIPRDILYALAKLPSRNKEFFSQNILYLMTGYKDF